MAIQYKIACEVILMHEYYQTESNGNTIFNLPVQNDRINYLFQQFQKGGKTISQDIVFKIPETLIRLYENHHIKIIPSYAGFKVAVKCRSKKLLDGTIVYEPVIPLPPELDLIILLQQKNSITTFSGTAIKKPFASSFYFSSNDFAAAKTFPFLSLPVSAFDAGKIYEQGEIALFNPNDVRLFLNNGAADPWLTLSGESYVNEKDRWLVPLAFPYTFTIADNVTDVAFILKNSTGSEIKKIARTNNIPLKSVLLNFRTNDSSISTIPDKSPDTESIYTLEVTGNNGYNRQFSILFVSDEINLSTAAGLISLKITASNTLFNLTDNNGLLHTRILPDTSKQTPPVFELWMKSRLVYWHYQNNKQKKIKLTADTQDILEDVSGVLVTKNPQPLSYTPVLLKKPDNSFQYLPNPLPGDSVKVNGSKNSISILVPESKMFPLV